MSKPHNLACGAMESHTVFSIQTVPQTVLNINLNITSVKPPEKYFTRLIVIYLRAMSKMLGQPAAHWWRFIVTPFQLKYESNVANTRAFKFVYNDQNISLAALTTKYKAYLPKSHRPFISTWKNGHISMAIPFCWANPMTCFEAESRTSRWIRQHRRYLPTVPNNEVIKAPETLSCIKAPIEEKISQSILPFNLPTLSLILFLLFASGIMSILPLVCLPVQAQMQLEINIEDGDG